MWKMYKEALHGASYKGKAKMESYLQGHDTHSNWLRSVKF